jgi:hypothetical protein
MTFMTYSDFISFDDFSAFIKNNLFPHACEKTTTFS